MYNHFGLVEKCWKYFKNIVQYYCITPREENYICMVNILGRDGHLGKAQYFIEKIPTEPFIGVSKASLGGCRIHGNIKLGEHVEKCLFI